MKNGGTSGNNEREINALSNAKNGTTAKFWINFVDLTVFYFNIKKGFSYYTNIFQ